MIRVVSTAGLCIPTLVCAVCETRIDGRANGLARFNDAGETQFVHKVTCDRPADRAVWDRWEEIGPFLAHLSWNATKARQPRRRTNAAANRPPHAARPQGRG